MRDRAILETLYSTGIRRREATELSLFDVDAERGTLKVRQGKGNKDRVVPLGERVVVWIGRYLEEVRPQLVVPPDAGVLFLTLDGERLGCDGLSDRVTRYVRQAELGKTGLVPLVSAHVRDLDAGGRARTSARSRSFSGMRSCRRRRSTRGCRSGGSRRCTR